MEKEGELQDNICVAHTIISVRRRKQDGTCRDLERWTPRFAAYLGALYLPAVEALVVCGYR